MRNLKKILALCATYAVNTIIFPELKKITCTQPVPSINKQLSTADSKQDIYDQELHTHETETSSPCILWKKHSQNSGRGSHTYFCINYQNIYISHSGIVTSINRKFITYYKTINSS